MLTAVKMFGRLHLKTRLLVQIFFAAAVTTGLFSLRFIHPALQLPTWAFAPLGFAMLGAQLFWAYQAGRVMQRAREEGWRLCLICGSVVTRRGRNYQCPECGRRFSARELIRGWR